jgi:UBX domain-containing protein 1
LGQPVATWNGPDDSKPVASVQLRFPDGSRLVGRFNHDQTVQEIRSFVAAARPHDKAAYVMLTGFPQKALEDESQTIADAGLINAVVTFKRA